jgi:hypothetical protein
MHWKKFSEARFSLSREKALNPGYLNFFEKVFDRAQRFYFSDASAVTIDINSRESKANLEFPHHCLAILNERAVIAHDGNADKTYEAKTWSIVLCVIFPNDDQIGSADWQKLYDTITVAEETPKHRQLGEKFAVITSLVRMTPFRDSTWRGPDWAISPFLLLGGFGKEDEVGYRVHYRDFRKAFIYHAEDHESEQRHISHAQSDFTLSLCLAAFCSLKNVETHEIAPPRALSIRRKKRKKLPLFSYKVLKVDGEVWDRPHVSTGEGHGVRSHMRRGHIMRLQDGRRVWRRGCFVRGSRPGVIEHEYHLQPKAVQ